MSDLIARLRNHWPVYPSSQSGFEKCCSALGTEAAAELERLTAENDALRADAERRLSALINLRAAARLYLPDYDKHPAIQDADAAIDAARSTQPAEQERKG